MVSTVREAECKHCCGPENCGFQGNNTLPIRYCETSNCMAWVWHKKPKEGYRVPKEDWTGYCGLTRMR